MRCVFCSRLSVLGRFGIGFFCHLVRLYEQATSVGRGFGQVAVAQTATTSSR
jgi:hypothetical protein